MNKKLNVKRIRLLGQDYLIKSSESAEMLKIADYVDKKMQEVIDSGVDKDSQQLRIAVFTCLEIAGELFLYKKKNQNILNKIEKKSNFLIELIDEKLKENL
jgi:cell division protein ZapA (FtsZ GTPase activity inhibitor)